MASLDSERIELQSPGSLSTNAHQVPETIDNVMSEIHSSSLPPVDKGLGAWSFILAAFLIDALLWGFPMSYGTFLEAYLRNEVYSSQPHADVLLPLIGQLSTGLMYCSGPVIYPLADRYPEYRRAGIWLGAAIAGASLFAASFVTNIVALVLLQGGLYGIGGSLLYAPCISFLHEWFVTRRGFANGVIFAGLGTGGILFPLVLPPIIAAVGVAKAVRYMAIIVVGILVPVIPFYKGRLPQTRTYIQGPTPRGARGRSHPLWKPSFLAFLVVNLIQSLAHFLPLTWLPTFASDMNLGPDKSSLALALLNGATIFSQLGLGYLADKYNPWLLSSGTLFLASVCAFVLWGVLSHTIGGLIAFGLVYGLVIGGWASLFSAFVRIAITDDRNMSTSLFGYLLFTRGLGNVFSTPVASALRSATATAVHLNPSGFAVGGGRFANMIIYVGSSFAGASGLAAIGWGYDLLKAQKP